MSDIIEISGRPFSEAHVCIIGEIAQAHDGSLGMAHAFIDAIADAGADAVKFQTHIAAAESTALEPWRVKFSPQDASRFDYWKRMEFTEEQWAGLKQHADERNILFLSSAFSPEAVELLERVGIPAWKVASGEMTNVPLIERMLTSRLPMLFSSGMSTLAELDRAVGLSQKAGVPTSVFQCTTAYPCPPEIIGLNQISALKERYRVPVGLSDHSGTIYAGLAAAALGVSLIEVHIAFHRKMFGPDVPASLTPEELRQLVEGARFIERMRNSPVDKDAFAQSVAPMRMIFGKSAVARTQLPAGHLISETDLCFKKAGQGIPAEDHRRLIGLKLQRGMAADEPFQWSNTK